MFPRLKSLNGSLENALISLIARKIIFARLRPRLLCHFRVTERFLQTCCHPLTRPDPMLPESGFREDASDKITEIAIRIV